MDKNIFKCSKHEKKYKCKLQDKSEEKSCNKCIKDIQSGDILVLQDATEKIKITNIDYKYPFIDSKGLSIIVNLNDIGNYITNNNTYGNNNGDENEGELKDRLIRYYTKNANKNGFDVVVKMKSNIITVVDSLNNVGISSSMQIINGLPAITYYDFTDGNLKYARSNTANGKGPWNIIIIDSVGDVGQFTSLSNLGMINGYPSVAYYDSTNQDLKYARSLDLNGLGIWQIQVIDSVGDVGAFTSLSIVNGRPAIAYNDGSNLDLKYARANNMTGIGLPWNIVTVDSIGNVGLFASLAVVNYICGTCQNELLDPGYPAIAYYDITNTSLKYAVSSTNDGENALDWTAITIDTGNVGTFASLDIVDSNPAVSYYDINNQNLKYIRSTNSIGRFVSDWSLKVTVDSIGNVGSHTSLSVINGNPAISYKDETNQNLKYARATNSIGSGVWKTYTLDTIGNVGEFTSLITVKNRPAISYYDVTNGNLKYIRGHNKSSFANNSVYTVEWLVRKNSHC